MATLEWTNSLPTDNCFKAEGDAATWLIRPSIIDGKWNLWQIAKDSAVACPEDAGIFESLGQARAAAQSAENGHRNSAAGSGVARPFSA